MASSVNVITNPTSIDKFFASFSTGITANAKLGKFNRLQVVFNSKDAVLNADKMAGLLLAVKTLYGLEHPVTISNCRCVTDITTNITKAYQTQAYKKQNKVMLTGSLSSQGKANLFGWNPIEDGQVYDKYVSQPPITPYSKTVIGIDPIITDTGLEIIFIKDLLVPTHKYYNLCKDTAIVEKYMSYELKLDSTVIFCIKQYYATGTTGLEFNVNGTVCTGLLSQCNGTGVPLNSKPTPGVREFNVNGTYKRTVICMECEFNEENRVLPEKFARTKAYIDNISYILTNA